MKKNTLKKLTAAALALAMALSLCACSGNSGSGSAAGSSAGSGEPVESGSSGTASAYTVAIVKQMDHPSLDEITNAITARLDEIAAESGVSIAYEVYSGQDDESVLNQIGAQVITDGVDAIIPVATTAAQLMTCLLYTSPTPRASR